MPDRDESTTGWAPASAAPTPPAQAPSVRAQASDAPAQASTLASPGWLERNLPLSLDAYEKAALERALVETWGDASEAARLLGIGRSTFYRKAGKHGINLAELRSPASAPAGRAHEPLAPARPTAEGPHDGDAEPHGVGTPETLG